MRKTILAAAIAVLVALPAAAQQHRYGHHGHHHHGPNPWGVAGAVVGSMALGAIIGQALAPPPPQPMFHAPLPPIVVYPQGPSRCWQGYVGDDAWGRPMFGTACQ